MRPSAQHFSLSEHRKVLNGFCDCDDFHVSVKWHARLLWLASILRILQSWKLAGLRRALSIPRHHTRSSMCPHDSYCWPYATTFDLGKVSGAFGKAKKSEAPARSWAQSTLHRFNNGHQLHSTNRRHFPTRITRRTSKIVTLGGTGAICHRNTA